MKNKILLTSGGLVILSAVLGIGNALFGQNPELMFRVSAVAGILTAGSIGLFFVGLAYPKEGPTELSVITKKVSNG